MAKSQCWPLGESAGPTADPAIRPSPSSAVPGSVPGRVRPACAPIRRSARPPAFPASRSNASIPAAKHGACATTQLAATGAPVRVASVPKSRSVAGPANGATLVWSAAPSRARAQRPSHSVNVVCGGCPASTTSAARLRKARCHASATTAVAVVVSCNHAMRLAGAAVTSCSARTVSASRPAPGECTVEEHAGRDRVPGPRSSARERSRYRTWRGQRWHTACGPGRET